jgi:hypothetical protein
MAVRAAPAADAYDELTAYEDVTANDAVGKYAILQYPPSKAV